MDNLPSEQLPRGATSHLRLIAAHLRIEARKLAKQADDMASSPEWDSVDDLRNHVAVVNSIIREIEDASSE